MQVTNQSPDEILENQLSAREFGELFHARIRFNNSHYMLSKRKVPDSWKSIPQEYRDNLCRLYHWLAGVCEEMQCYPYYRKVVRCPEVLSIYGTCMQDVTAWHLIDIGINGDTEEDIDVEKYRYYLAPDGTLLRSLEDGTMYRMSYIPYQASATSGLNEEEVAFRNEHCYLNQKDLAALVAKLPPLRDE